MSITILYNDTRTMKWVFENDNTDVSEGVGFIFGDSRLWSLQGLDWNAFPMRKLIVVASRGAEVRSLYRFIHESLDNYVDRPVSIKVALGLNNLLNGQSPSVVFEHLISLKRDIMQQCHSCVFAFCDIAHINFEKSTRRQHFSTTQMNNRIDTLNKLIYSENKVLHSGSTPFLSTAVTKNVTRKDKKRGNRRYTVLHRYDSKLYDGIHVTMNCKKEWLHAFVKCFRLDSAKHFC